MTGLNPKFYHILPALQVGTTIVLVYLPERQIYLSETYLALLSKKYIYGALE